MKKVAFCTLGCKVNQFESSSAASDFAREGFEVVDFDEKADVYVINTCCVTTQAEKKSRNAIRRAKKVNPDAKIMICGCYSQLSPDTLSSFDVHFVGGSTGKTELAKMASRLMENEINKPFNNINYDILKAKDFEYSTPDTLELRTRAQLKVQDGCRNFCTYCIIPYVRGPVRSAKPKWVVEETKKLADEGYKEIVLAGIEIAAYGLDFGNVTLVDLIERVCEAVPDCRIRLSSLEPTVVDFNFVTRLSKCKNLMPHFHLSLQSGCDRTLKRMGRKYDTARYYKALCDLREHFPDVSITTDLIVGFPGETDEDFETTLRFIEKCGFLKVHVFPYSIRPGTPAAKMGEQIDKATKMERAKAATELSKRCGAEFIRQNCGKRFDVLFEHEKNGYFIGHTPNYIPVYKKSSENLENRIVKVSVMKPYKDGLLAE